MLVSNVPATQILLLLDQRTWGNIVRRLLEVVVHALGLWLFCAKGPSRCGYAIIVGKHRLTGSLCDHSSHGEDFEL